MTDADPPILGYQTPRRGFAAAPVWRVVLMAVLVPGLASVLICGKRRLRRMIGLCLTAIVAFVFFGPIWGEILFVRTRWPQAGIVPFIATCVPIVVTCIRTALRDQREQV